MQYFSLSISDMKALWSVSVLSLNICGSASATLRSGKKSYTCLQLHFAAAITSPSAQIRLDDMKGQTTRVRLATCNY